MGFRFARGSRLDAIQNDARHTAGLLLVASVFLTQWSCGSEGSSDTPQPSPGSEAGSKSSNASGAGGSGVSGAGGASSVAGGGASDGGGSSSSGASGAQGDGGEAASRELGQITVASFFFTRESGLGYTGIGATFGEELAHAECAREDYGGVCYVETCGTPTLAAKAPHAGTITVRSDAAGQGPFEQAISPDESGRYMTWTEGQPAFYGNNLLELSSSGGDVPAFAVDMAVYPEDFKLTSPSVPASDNHIGTLPVPRTEDFTLAWDKGFDDVIVAIQSDPAVQPGLVCRVPSVQKQFTIPKAALARVPAGTSGDFFIIRQKRIRAGNFDINLRLATLLLDPERTQRVVFELK
jgi:hypothetical protein